VGASNYVAVEPLGRYLYSSISGGGEIAGFGINADGSLQALTQLTFTSGQTPQAIVLDASGMYLYVANTGDGTIGSYTIDPSTGNLTAGDAPVTVGTAGQSIALSATPSGQIYFAAGNQVGSATINLTSGALAVNTGSQPTIAPGAYLTSDPAYKFLYSLEPAATSAATCQAETFSFGASGNPLWASVAGTRGNSAGIAFVKGNQMVNGPSFLYATVGGSGNLLFSVDPTTGILTNPVSVDGGR
jgi:DNA-binding beta-propeller fold protein YncE